MRDRQRSDTRDLQGYQRRFSQSRSPSPAPNKFRRPSVSFRDSRRQDSAVEPMDVSSYSGSNRTRSPSNPPSAHYSRNRDRRRSPTPHPYQRSSSAPRDFSSGQKSRSASPSVNITNSNIESIYKESDPRYRTLTICAFCDRVIKNCRCPTQRR